MRSSPPYNFPAVCFWVHFPRGEGGDTAANCVSSFADVPSKLCTANFMKYAYSVYALSLLVGTKTAKIGSNV